MKISELSPEEKIKLEKDENLLGESVGIYWRVAILLVLYFPIIDRILSVFTDPGIHAIPCGTFPFFYILVNLGSFFLALAPAFTWAGVWYYKKKWAIPAAIMISIALLVFGGGVLLGERGFGLFDALCLGILGATVFLSIKVKWPRFIWVILGYLGLLIILHYWLFQPLFPEVTWLGCEGKARIKPVQLVGNILAIITIIIMAILNFKKNRIKLLLRDIEHHRKHPHKHKF